MQYSKYAPDITSHSNKQPKAQNRNTSSSSPFPQQNPSNPHPALSPHLLPPLQTDGPSPFYKDAAHTIESTANSLLPPPPDYSTHSHPSAHDPPASSPPLSPPLAAAASLSPFPSRSPSFDADFAPLGTTIDLLFSLSYLCDDP